MRYLTLPGWHGSGPQHWQTLWEQQPGFRRVQQHDWEQPLRGDWMMQLEEQLLQSDEPVVLVAHSLGCWLVAAWAGHSQNVARVRAALLVAPPDLQQQPIPQLHSWKGSDTQRLPFASLVLASSNDPFCTLARSRELARQWGCQWQDVGALGHVNADSGLGDWPQGRLLLREWVAAA